MYGSAKVVAEVERKNKKMMTPQSQKQAKPKMSKIRGLSQAQSNKLNEHSKMHKGGMQSAHMKNMIKFMRQGDTFTVAHNKAKKIDNMKKK